MNTRHRDVSTETGTPLDAEGPLRRWARRRREVAREEEALAEARRRVAPEDRPEDRTEVPEPGADATEPAGVEDTVLTDEDMPSLESLDDNSDYSGFLSPGVSERLRRRALRKLFTSAVFNVPDGLDDYDDDFRSFEALGDIVTSDMRHQAEVEEERARQAQDTQARDTQARDTQARDTQARDTQAQDTQARDTQARDTQARDTQARDTQARVQTEPASGSQEESGRSEGEPLAHAHAKAASPTEEAPPGEPGPADPEALAGSEPPRVGMAEDSPQRSERADPAPGEPESGSEPMHARAGPTDHR